MAICINPGMLINLRDNNVLGVNIFWESTLHIKSVKLIGTKLKLYEHESNYIYDDLSDLGIDILLNNRLHNNFLQGHINIIFKNMSYRITVVDFSETKKSGSLFDNRDVIEEFYTGIIRAI